MDKEKIKRLAYAIHDWMRGVSVPTDIPVMAITYCMDALLEVLEAQEPVKPEREHSGGGSTWWNVCGACRTAINPNDKFCHECGRPVTWE